MSDRKSADTGTPALTLAQPPKVVDPALRARIIDAFAKALVKDLELEVAVTRASSVCDAPEQERGDRLAISGEVDRNNREQRRNK